MSKSGIEEYVDCRNDLLTAITVAQDRRDRGKANEGKRREYQIRLERINEELGDIIETGNHMKDIYKNIKYYADEHQKKARDILDLAIEEAGRLIPDADAAGIHLNKAENSRVTVVNGKGQNVNLREGGGYRTLLGVLLRYAALKAQPDALQLMLLDEQFFTLSDTTTAEAKPVFEAMKKDMTIICIEQRRNAMDGICNAEYVFRKIKDENDIPHTVVEKVL